MPEIRLNKVTGEWVIIATERAKRPEEFVEHREREPLPPHSPACPFCPGNEAKTPPQTFSLTDGEGRWLVRAVPNKFSALVPEGVAVRHDNGLRTHLSGVGLHEVIVECPEHDLTTALLPAVQIARILHAYRERFVAFYRDTRIEHVILFKNHGLAAGTSLEHSHSQIVGMPVVPVQTRSRIEEALRYYGDLGGCVYCRALREELADGVRVVSHNTSFVAFIPYAALSPFHIWIFPRNHCGDFGSVTDPELADLAAILKDVLLRLYRGLDNPDFNYVIRSLSPSEGSVRYFHWYLSLVPRVTRSAGFELGTGMFINTSLPEASAAFLREVDIGSSAT
jgi:UDPglucose--hexose-1-phosphate uridylyltransferase